MAHSNPFSSGGHQKKGSSISTHKSAGSVAAAVSKDPSIPKNPASKQKKGEGFGESRKSAQITKGSIKALEITKVKSSDKRPQQGALEMKSF